MKALLAATCLLAGAVLLGFGLMTIPASASPDLQGTPDPNTTPNPDDDHLVDVSSQNIPTYFEDIEPIIEANCVGCHVAGQIGYDVFPMDSHQDIIDAAEDVALVTTTEYMPPWMPGERSPAFKHERGLSDAEIQMIALWAENGTPLGSEEHRTVQFLGETAHSQIPTLDADLQLTMPEPYTPDEALTDDYRCFVIDPGLEANRFVTGYDIIPGETSLVHHVIIFQAPATARREAEAKARQDNRPGWQCFGDTNLSSASDELERMLGAWTPGSFPIEYPAGTGVEVRAGNLLILQVHYNTEAGVKPDQTMIRLQLADPDEPVAPLFTFPIFGPVELPCPPGVEGEACNRREALFEANDFFSNDLLTRCGVHFLDFADQPADAITSTCDAMIPLHATIHGTMGHMHELGKSTSLVLNPSLLDESQVILDIPAWDFHWQGSYLLQEPIEVKPGDRLRLTCVWDNSENTRYVVWGDRTQDEMCVNFVLFQPHGR